MTDDELLSQPVTLSAFAKTIFSHQERGDSLSDPTIPALVKYESLLRYRFAQNHAKGMTVLDIGCGYGYGSYLLSKCAKSVTGIDYDGDVISAATAKYPRANLKFFAADAAGFLSNTTEQFQLITMFETIEHVPDQSRLMRLVGRALSADGTLIISTPNRRYTTFYRHNPYHLKELDMQEFVSLIEIDSELEVKVTYGQTPGSLVLVPLPYYLLAYVVQSIPGGIHVCNFTEDGSKSRTMYAVAVKKQLDTITKR